MDERTNRSIGRQASSGRRFYFSIDPRPCRTVIVCVHSSPEELAIKAIVPCDRPLSAQDEAFIWRERKSLQQQYPADFQ